MKRLVFKEWVTNMLLGLIFITLLVMASDSDNIKIFIISHIIALIIFLINVKLIIKYSRKKIIE